MTRETYIKVANAVKKQMRKHPVGPGRHVVVLFAIQFIRLAADDNPRFNDRRFLRACGILEEKK